MSKDTNQEPHKPVSKAAHQSNKQPKRRGFLANVFSHLAVAAIAVIGVGSYVHWDEILNYTGSRVCAYNVLGKYAGTPVKLPPIDLKKPSNAESAKTSTQPEPAKDKPSKVKTPSDTKSEAETSAKKPKEQPEAKLEKKPKQVVKEKSFSDELQAARKQFWENDKAAVQAYEALVKKQPENADLRAEMANVYYKNGVTSKAADAFLSAGKMFITNKKPEKAKSIGDILKRISPEKSAQYLKLLNTAAK